MESLVVLNGCRTIQLTRGMNTLIDETDIGRAGVHSWQARKGKRTFYAAGGRNIGNGKTASFQLHRVLIGAPKGAEVDHRNGDGLDNRRGNLRLATSQQNSRNRHRCVGRSRYKGIAPAGPSWRAYISVGRRKIHLGCFPTEEEAARAYDAGAREHYGEFAATNADIFGDY
jgi:hypothetical protein